MRTLLACLAFSLAAGALAAQAKPDPDLVFKSISMKGYKGDVSNKDPRMETVITSEAELAKAVPDKEWQTTIGKQVDFKKEVLVLFAWAGVAGESYSAKVSGKDTVTFTHKSSKSPREQKQFYAYAVLKTYKYVIEGK